MRIKTSIASGQPLFRPGGARAQRVAGALLALGLAGSCPPGNQALAQAQSDPRAAFTALSQANRLFKEGKPDDALKALDAALKSSPRDPQLRFLYGVILNDRGRNTEALDVFQQLTQDYPELPEPYNNLAVLLASRGDLDQARTALEAAVRALPSYALAFENLGDVYLRMSVRSYERATRAGTVASARNKLAMARELMGKVVPVAPAKAAPVNPGIPAAPEIPAAPANPGVPGITVPGTSGSGPATAPVSSLSPALPAFPAFPAPVVSAAPLSSPPDRVNVAAGQ